MTTISTPIRPETMTTPECPHTRLDVPRHDFLGVEFHPMTMDESLDTIEEIIRDRIPRQINFVNAYTLTVCRRNQPFARILNGSDLNLPDGMSVVWGGRWLDMDFPQRVAGPDITEKLCARAEIKGHTVFFMGSSDENLKALNESLLKKYPNLKIVGLYSPSVSDKFDEKETADIIAAIHKVSPDVLFVGVSTGKQERWISENLQRIGVPACLAVGAAFDFLSGRIPRSPEWLSEHGLEWAFRLYCEPRRLWKRYLLGNAVFLTILAKKKVKRIFGWE